MDTWNRERKRTRDRLSDYEISKFDLVYPCSKSKFDLVYPWYNHSLNVLSKQLYELASKHGFTGTQDNLINNLFQDSIMIESFENFPIPGNVNLLYLDSETSILYYFKETTNDINIEVAETIGAKIVGQNTDEVTGNIITYMYIPVRAMLIENSIIVGGDAAEYID